MNKDYTLYETITQTYVDDNDPTVKYVAKGKLVGWDDSNGIIRYIQDPRLHCDEEGKMYEFEGDAPIIGEVSGKETIPDLGVSEKREGMTFSNGYAPSEAKKYTGSLDYVTNITPVVRAPNQSERVSLIISY